MLRVEESARRRFALLGGVMVIFLGGMVVTGLVERLSTPAGANADPIDMAKARVEAGKRREVRREAAELGKRGRWRDAVRFLKVAEQQQISSPYLVAEAALHAGMQEEARRIYLKILPTDDPVAVATRMILEKKSAEYQKFCEEKIFDLARREPTANEANNVAWLAALAPDALRDYTPAIELAKIGVIGADIEDQANFLNTLGVVQYRAGQYADAIESLRGADNIYSDPFNWVFLALSYHGMGDDATAKKYYARAKEKIGNTFGKPPELNRHELLLFFQEASSIFDQPAETPAPKAAS